jgi:hypothetical protein
MIQRASGCGCRLVATTLDRFIDSSTTAAKALARLFGAPQWLPAAEARAQVCHVTA